MNNWLSSSSLYKNEVINEIRKRHIPTIAGNYNFGIAITSDDCGCAYKTDIEKSNGSVSIAYTNEINRDAERKYLMTMPSHIRLEFQSLQVEFIKFGMIKERGLTDPSTYEN